VPFLHKDITMTDAAGLYLDANSLRPRFRQLTIHGLERATWTTHLYCGHLGHYDLLGDS
jgi:hypothetical protein